VYAIAWPTNTPKNAVAHTMLRGIGSRDITPMLRALGVGGEQDVRAKDVKRVGVVGFGLMGSGIAQVLAGVGIEVVVLEPTEELLARGRERVDASTGRAVERGKLDHRERDALVGRIRGTTEVASLADVQLAIEAATEDRDAKIAIFRELDRVVGADAILASNTSSIPIATLASATSRPDKVVGLHFFNPPPAMDLVEVTPSLMTSADTVSFAQAFGERLGKTTVLAKDEAGFIVNRLLIPYLCAAIRLLDAGFATREDIDASITLGLNHPMGPLGLADLIGLDTVLQIAEVLFEEFREPAYAPPPRLRRMVAAGRLGRKSGTGFYDYG
jgi:3-hydroxybutyryl-CoA dehydrogenase